MSTLMGVLGLLLIVGGGCCIVRTAFDEKDMLVVFSVGSGASLLGMVFLASLALHFASIGPVVVATVGINALILGRFYSKLRDLERPSRLEVGLLSFTTAVIVSYAVFFLSMRQVVEDSFFLHCANTGLILGGTFPPVNFFGEVLHGHYGRDLLVALISRLLDIQFLNVEWAVRAGLNGLGFVIAYSWLRVETKNKGVAAGGALFLYFGANYCSYTGQFDFLTNNQPTALMSWLLCSYACFRALKGKGWWLTGILLGTDALIYEIHFVMLCLTLTAFAFAQVVRRRTPKQALWTLLIASVVAVSVGGAISHVVLSRLGEHETVRATDSSAQHVQNVSMKFPKEKLFQLRLDNLRPSRPFETKLRSWKPDFTPSNAYAPIWSSHILNAFWYPVWLFPLTLVWAVRQRSAPALWLLLLGSWGWLLPSVIDFGFWEQETFRWLNYPAWCWSTAFGMMVGSAFQARGKWRVPILLFAAWAFFFCIAGFRLELSDWTYYLSHRGEPGPDGSPGLLREVGVIPNPAKSLAHNYNFSEAEWNSAIWLRVHAKPGDKYVWQDGPPAGPGEQHHDTSGGEVLNLRGIITGLSGMLPADLAPVTRNDVAAFDLSQQNWLFWATLDPKTLAAFDAEWLVLKPAELPAQAYKHLCHNNTLGYESEGRTVLALPSPEPIPDSRPGAAVIKAALPSLAAKPLELAVWSVSVSGLSYPGSWVQLRILKGEGPYLDPIELFVAPGTKQLIVPCPKELDQYKVQYRWRPNGEWSDLGALSIEQELPRGPNNG